MEVEGPENRVANLTTDDKLQIATDVLLEINEILQSDKVEFKGTEEFKPYAISKIFKDKTLNIFVNDSGDQEFGVGQSQTSNQDLRIDLSKKDWYAFNDNYGTSEEKYLVKFIDKTYDVLKKQFSDIYLIRNEKHFQLYRFEDGQVIQPDFVLFMKKKEGDETVHYQVFIEPKGSHLLDQDKLKELFLISLKKQFKITTLWKSKKFTVWGLPFYNEKQRKTEFERAFSELYQ